MKRLLSIIISLTVCAAMVTSHADNATLPVDPDDLTLDEQLKSPEVPRKASAQIVKRMDDLSKLLAKNKYTVSGFRNNEALRITIPGDDLFIANTDSLKTSANVILKPFKTFLEHKKDYKIVILAHTDNTGDEKYSDDITDDRSRAVYEYFQDLTGDDDINVYPYGMGFDEPLVDNNSIVNRRKNRRIEIYIIPDDELIARAKAGKLI